jgi:hypothetical protein
LFELIPRASKIICYVRTEMVCKRALPTWVSMFRTLLWRCNVLCPSRRKWSRCLISLSCPNRLLAIQRLFLSLYGMWVHLPYYARGMMEFPLARIHRSSYRRDH